jgi:hypothetical protein
MNSKRKNDKRLSTPFSAMSKSLTAVMLLFLVPTLVCGAKKYWSGTNTWNAANVNWSSTTGGGAGPYTNVTFATNDDAFFEGTAGTVSAPNNPNSLTFNVTAYMLSGGRQKPVSRHIVMRYEARTGSRPSPG